MREIRKHAHAKINLGLDVLRRRPDGYHEVRMIMQTIGLHDEITIERTQETGIKISTNIEGLPVNRDNLIYKAARLLMDEFQITDGVRMKLQKNIPVAAGMAGGSSDAAAVLLGINEMFELGLTEEELKKRAVCIGADVPYCVMGGTALAEGIGEILTPLPAIPECHILIAKPPIEVSTRFVYTELRADELKSHPDIDGQIEAVQKGDLHGMCERMGNVLETVTIPAYPVIGEIRDMMLESGALNAMMSGSGPTVFGIFEREESAREAAARLKSADEDRQVILTSAF